MDTRELTRQEAIGAFLDGELPADESAAFERRVAADSDLAREVETMRSVDALLDLYDVPPDLGGNLADEVAAAVSRPVGRIHRLRAPLAAAAVLLIGLLITLSTLENRTSPPRPDGDDSAHAEAVDEQRVIAALHRVSAHDLRELGLDAADVAFLRVAHEEAPAGR